MKAIKEPLIILGVFILFKIVQAAYALAANEHPSYLLYVRLAEIFIFATISYLAVKRKVAALRTMGVILLLQVFAVGWAVFLIPLEQIIFKVFATVLSVYFVFGGTVLIRLAKARNEKQDKTNNTGITRPLDADRG
ncbi:MAG: hypothetical protein PHD01_05165 [Geobacteraceae bacterium]|nr:hypothetical protein [Geobacteraceae bacterium]